MFILRDVTDEHVDKWVVTKAGSDTIVAYDADFEEALKKAKAAGIEQQNATIVFVYPAGMSLIYTSNTEERARKLLGDQRKGVVFQSDPMFLG